MARRPLRNYLRTHRKGWALSQKQLAGLLGFRFPTHLSKYELDQRLPSLRTALACEIVFGVPVSVLFEGLRAEVEEDVMRRANALFEGIEHRTDPAGKRKRELLMAMLARVTDKSNP
jgi:transcriptional regulator with XRE-family HTH domain